NILSVDIFGLSPAREVRSSNAVANGVQQSTTFAVGEESDSAAAAADVEVAPLVAPLDRVDATVRPGETYRADVVGRTRQSISFLEELSTRSMSGSNCKRPTMPAASSFGAAESKTVERVLSKKALISTDPCNSTETAIRSTSATHGPRARLLMFV